MLTLNELHILSSKNAIGIRGNGMTQILILFLIKPTGTLIPQIYFCLETLHVSGSSSPHHQDFSTVHSALV